LLREIETNSTTYQYVIRYTEEIGLHKTSYTTCTLHALTFESEPEHRQIS